LLKQTMCWNFERKCCRLWVRKCFRDNQVSIRCHLLVESRKTILQLLAWWVNTVITCSVLVLLALQFSEVW